MPLLLPRLAVTFTPHLVRARTHRWLLLLSFSLLAGGAMGCRPATPPRPQASPPAAQAQTPQQQQAARQCLQRRQALQEGLAELRRAEAALADQRAAAPPPASAPPVWDEAMEQRFSQADQELDRQRHEQELEAWRQRRADRQVLIDAQRQRLEQAQQRLDRQAQLLRRQYPDLFTAPTSIELKPQELERLNRCPEGPA